MVGLVVVGLALAQTPKASSELAGGGHGAAEAFDGRLTTSWCEGAAGAGDESWVELDFATPTPIEEVSLWVGNLASAPSLAEFGRPRLIGIRVEGPMGVLTEQLSLEDPKDIGPQRIDVPIVGVASNVRVTMHRTRAGGRDDACIAEVGIDFHASRVPAAVASAQAAAADATGPEIDAWVAAAAGGDAAARAKLVAQAGDGGAAAIARAADAPAGWKVRAIPPDRNAVAALRDRGGPEAAFALRLAASRLAGAEADAILLDVARLDATRELARGPQPVPAWGRSGWEPGALRAFGTPAGVAFDGMGRLLVADPANHRVQRFLATGFADRQWGGPPGVEDRFLGKPRTPWIAGAAASLDPGGFTSPLDVAPIGKAGFVVVDAAGQVRRFDDAGNLAASWPIAGGTPVDPQHTFVEVVGQKILVVWGADVFVHALDGALLAQWKVAAGPPEAVCTVRANLVGFVSGADLVGYSPTGETTGVVDLVGPAGEVRGTGWSKWDCAVDEAGKLWALTDTGMAAKYRRPGDPELAAPVVDPPLSSPRFAVRGGVVYIVSDDHVIRVDAHAASAQ